MSGIEVSPPKEFNFREITSWPKWLMRFEQFIQIKGNEKPDKEKCNILLYCMGEESLEIVNQIGKPEKYEDLVNKLTDYFNPRKNLIFERAQFNRAQQQPGESNEEYIKKVYKLAQYCEFDKITKEEILRDKLVVGIADRNLSEKLQLKNKLKLEEAIQMIRENEIQKYQTQQLYQEIQEQDRNMFVIKKTMNSRNLCNYCGYNYHPRTACPARNAECFKCKIKGHFSRTCKKSFDNQKINSEKKLNILEEAVENSGKSNEYFLSSIDECDIKAWRCELVIEEFKIKSHFLIDSGADIVCIPLSLIPLQLHSQIKSTNITVRTADQRKLDIFGYIAITLKYKELSYQTKAYIIKTIQKPILSRKASLALKILSFNVNMVNLENNKSSVNIHKEFPLLLQDLGKFKDIISIKLKPDSKPFVQSTPRIVPIALLEKLDKELKRLQSLDIIEPVEQVTEWVSPIVVVQKNENDIRLCCDYTQLNKNVMRPYFPIPKVEYTLAKVKGAKYFSKIDITKSFHQLILDEESQLLTTFICPFGRFKYKRLPFGLNCSTEYFVSKFSKLFDGLNVIFHVDDVLIFHNDIKGHDECLREVLKRISEAGLTININKCVIGVQEIKFLGFHLSKSGISIDSDRTNAITNFPKPVNKTELQRFLGMVNFASRHLNKKSDCLEPLNNLLKKDIDFYWGPDQDLAFNSIKKLLCEAPILAYFDYKKQIVISADASSYGLGGCLMQIDKEGNREIVAYISRTLSETERRYSQIEKETLALTWAAERFYEYITGIKIIMETDHKPLLQILQTKHLDELTPRLQRFRIRLMRFNYDVKYVPGKELVLPDSLSRSPLSNLESDEDVNDCDLYVNFIVKNLPLTDIYLEKIRKEQENDRICIILKKYCLEGWPEKSKILPELLPYFQFRYDLSLCKGLILKSSRIVIPFLMQKEVLEDIHMGHQGIVKCRRRAQMAVWWIGISTQIENLIRNCPNCIEHKSNPVNTFCKNDTPASRPWQVVAADLFFHSKWYLIVTDYFSRFFEIFELNSLTENVIIEKVKELFSRYGICETFRSDNGPQFKESFKRFSQEYNFVHVTSSPYYSQSNGLAENAVKIAKSLIKKNCKQIDKALLAYRTTPLENGFSPAELLMGRKLRSHLPLISHKLETTNTKKICRKENVIKDKQAYYYNKRHRTKPLSDLNVGDNVWMIDKRIYGTITEVLPYRSYIIETNQGQYRRNRWHIIPAPYVISERKGQEYNSQCNIGDDSNDNTNSQNICNQNPLIDNDVINNNETPIETEPVNISRPVRHRQKPLWINDYIT